MVCNNNLKNNHYVYTLKFKRFSIHYNFQCVILVICIKELWGIPIEKNFKLVFFLTTLLNRIVSLITGNYKY